MPTPLQLRTVALQEFATSGYLGASIARIAERAGMSKASVLYHYASKEALLDAVVDPAIEAFAALLDRATDQSGGLAADHDFIEAFVDFLLQYRLEVHLFMNQRRSLEGVPVMARADEIVRRVVAFRRERSTDVLDELRFGIALGGAAYCLVNRDDFEADPVDEQSLRAGLIAVMSELLSPSGRPMSATANETPTHPATERTTA